MDLLFERQFNLRLKRGQFCTAYIEKGSCYCRDYDNSLALLWILVTTFFINRKGAGCWSHLVRKLSNLSKTFEFLAKYRNINHFQLFFINGFQPQFWLLSRSKFAKIRPICFKALYLILQNLLRKQKFQEMAELARTAWKGWNIQISDVHTCTGRISSPIGLYDLEICLGNTMYKLKSPAMKFTPSPSSWYLQQKPSTCRVKTLNAH